MRTLFPLIQAKGTFANKLLGTSLESLLNLGLTWKPEVFIYLCFQKLCFWRTHTRLQMILPWFPSSLFLALVLKMLSTFSARGQRKGLDIFPLSFRSIHSSSQLCFLPRKWSYGPYDRALLLSGSWCGQQGSLAEIKGRKGWVWGPGSLF